MTPLLERFKWFCAMGRLPLQTVAGAIGAVWVFLACLYFCFQDTIQYSEYQLSSEDGRPGNLQTYLNVLAINNEISRFDWWPFHLYSMPNWFRAFVNVSVWLFSSVSIFCFFRTIKCAKVFVSILFALLVVGAIMLTPELSLTNILWRYYDFFPLDIRHILFFSVMSGVWLGTAGRSDFEVRELSPYPLYSVKDYYDLALLPLASFGFMGLNLFLIGISGRDFDLDLALGATGWPFKARVIGLPLAILELLLVHICLFVFGRNFGSNRSVIRIMLANMVLVPFFFSGLHPDFSDPFRDPDGRRVEFYKQCRDFGFFFFLSYVLFAIMNLSLLMIQGIENRFAPISTTKRSPKD